MGEVPLNSITDPHAMRGAALSTLDRWSRKIQAKGWWFNREPRTLSPSPADSNIYLSNDIIEVRVYPNRQTGLKTRNVVMRTNRLYDLDEGVYTFDDDVEVELIRLIPFENLPDSASSHIAAMAVHAFQTQYDGDSTKTRELKDRIENPKTGTLVTINSVETRQRQVNMIDSNSKLQRIKTIVRRARSLRS
jgi:hypothetical protein